MSAASCLVALTVAACGGGGQDGDTQAQPQAATASGNSGAAAAAVAPQAVTGTASIAAASTTTGEDGGLMRVALAETGDATVVSALADGTEVLALSIAPTRTGAAAAAPAAAETWILCASEGGRCDFSGTRVVRYGAGTAVVERSLSNGADCSNRTFGDPVVGIAKSCWLQSLPEVTWVPCANENGRCSFTGTLSVRYGAGTSIVTRDLAGPVACSNSTFGDPIVGVAKSCWYASTAAATAPVTGDVCEALPALPAVPAAHNVVTSFCRNGICAKPNDGIDDTDAIDDALNQSAGKFLVFPAGTYQISRSLRVKKAGVTLWGPGATIHATNWDDQSIIVEANDTSIYSFRLTAVTAQRGSRAEHTRIAIYGPASVNPVVKNTIIRNNEIVNAGAPGTNLANAATGAGIFVNAADGFLIAGNTVARTLADGIHITGGARNGRVLQNTVRETGDDMLAVVSYAYPNPTTNTAATIAGTFASALGTYQVRNVLLANNKLSGQYWGRGIAVVGGRDLTIRGNTLNNIPYGAAVLLARETQSGSYGLANILVENNTISEVQTMSPPYDFGGKFASHGRTGHGAIEVHGSMFNDELGYPLLVGGMAMAQLTVQNNTVTASATPAVRIGVGNGSTWMMGARAVSGTAPLSNLVLARNAFSDIRNGNQIIQMLASSSTSACSANTLNGNALNANCTAATSSVAVGATLTCIKP